MTHFGIIRAAALAAALIVSGGCATKGDLRTLRVEMQGLGARQDSLLAVLERQNASTQDTLRRQNDQLFEIRGDVSRQLQQILDELVTLHELAGQNQRTIAALRDQVERMGSRSIGQGPTESVVGGPDELGGPVAGTGGAEATYNAAVDAHRRGSLTTAEAAFEDFLRVYPTDPLAPQVHFYLGDIHEQRNQLREAIQAFGQIPALFPTHERVPDALYRIGLLHVALGAKDEGLRFLDRVVNTYPDSDAASLAREQLRELR